MKNKVRISEGNLVKLIEKVINEESKTQFRTVGMDLVGKSDEEKSMEIKVDYFLNIFLPRFQQIKEVHGLELTFELIKRLAERVENLENN
jgi:hypothetical protein